MNAFDLESIEDDEEDFDLCIEIYENNFNRSELSYNREFEYDAVPMTISNREEW